MVRARAGDEVFERLVDPLLGGINAGNADNLSIAAGARALADAARRGGPFIEALREQRASVAPGPVFHGVANKSTRAYDVTPPESPSPERPCAASASPPASAKQGATLGNA